MRIGRALLIEVESNNFVVVLALEVLVRAESNS